MAGFIDLLLPPAAVSFQFDLEVFADMDRLNALVTEVLERALDGFALRIENRFFWQDHDFRFHER